MALTPMMRQYFEIKERYQDCIVFFRLGDFYEMFFDDAKTASRELELVLTGRDCGMEERAPMCGIPFHAAASYITRLVKKGYKVGICEQVEDVSVAKGIVKRDVVKVITPGTFVEASSDLEYKNTYLVSIVEENGEYGVSSSDISTGEFKTTSFRALKSTLIDEITKISPKEILVDVNFNVELVKEIHSITNALITIKDYSTYKSEEDLLANTFSEVEASGLTDASKIACDVLLKYLYDTQKTMLSNINYLEVYDIVNYMTIDGNSRRNLELTETLKEKSKKGSLIWVLDKTNTAMGARALRKWIEEPLISKAEIEKRHLSVGELISDFSLKDDLKEHLKDIYDIERIVGKVSSKNANGKDLVSLRSSLSRLPAIKETLGKCESPLLKEWYSSLDTLDELNSLLCSSLLDDPSMAIKEGNIIRDGYNTTVDELRQGKLHGKEWIASLENREREFTGIRSLKVGYNKVFGYYIEISRANYDSIPEGRYVRKQTLANAERFITQELKEMEEKILGAEEKLTGLEYELFLEVRDKVEIEIPKLKKTARIISQLDALLSLATIALDNDYVMPKINEDGIIDIKEGRHPVVEKVIGRGEFISNNTLTSNEKDSLLLITGPNMAGKSTYMRQVALITLMAQVGSFVPATEANISVCDKIFTRIGASDDLAGGKSTFMVEMWEVSNILRNATSKSLVLLDEVGRGTSTYDGLSIAWSVIEHICKDKSLKCKTLFATHYHELTKLEGVIPGVKNYSVAVKEVDDNVVFLRKIVEGGADQSYGIEVAKLAGIPNEVIERAKDILSSLEGEKSIEITATSVVETQKEVCVTDISEEKMLVYAEKNICSKCEKVALLEEKVKEYDIFKEENNPKPKQVTKESLQMNFEMLEKEDFLKELANVDVLSINPMEAMNKLYKIVQDAKKLS